MSRTVDPYYEWLSIPPKDQPPNHYRLLGLDLFEENRDVIDSAANRQMTFVKSYQTGAESAELSQRILNELAGARICLLNPQKKEAYDRKLRTELEIREPRVSTRPKDRPRTEFVSPKPPLSQTKESDRPRRLPMASPVREPPIPLPAPKITPTQSEADNARGESRRANPSSAETSVLPKIEHRAMIDASEVDSSDSHAVVIAVAVGVGCVLLTILIIALLASHSSLDVTQDGRESMMREPPIAPGDASAATPHSESPKPEIAVPQSGRDGDKNADFAPASIVSPSEPKELDDIAVPQSGTDRDKNSGFAPTSAMSPREPKQLDETPLQDEVPFAEAMVAITNGRLEQARPLLHRVMESPNTQQRTWARQMLEELRIATSDEAAGELLDQQFSDEQLEWLVKGEALIDIEGLQFSYPALRERFEQTMKKNAHAALERRRADRAEAMAGTSDRPSDDPAPHAEDPPDKPKGTETRPPASPAELLENRGLRKREEYWLLEGDDQLRESVDRVEGLARSSRAADTALLDAVNKYGESANHVAMAERTGRNGIVEDARRALNNMKREYREVAATSMKARGALTVASLRAARRVEEMTARYQELADDAEVQRALEQLGSGANKLGPTPALGRNLKRIQSNDERLLTDKVMGFFGGEEESVFHVEAIVNDRASALFAFRPQAEFSLIPEHVLREAGIPYDAEWKLEREVNGVSFRSNRVVIPSLRLGRFVSANIEAFVLPADTRNLSGFLADNAFPNFRIDVKPGESVARLRPTR